MNRYVYIPILIVIGIFLSASLASMRDDESSAKDIAPLPDKMPETISAPILIKHITDRGQLLYENHCKECHNDSVHNRNHSKAQSVEDIQQWVLRWSKNLKLDWKKQDVDMVSDYLNQRFYHFSTEK